MHLFNLSFICLLVFRTNAQTISKDPVVVLVVFDGFTHSFIDETRTPNIEKIRKQGSYSNYLKNVFVTKTFPNMFTLATGVYPETHGVLDNSVFNIHTTKNINYSDELFHYTDQVMPIWVLNELSDGRRHSGCMMWVGGEFEYRNKNPTFQRTWNKSVPWEERVDIVKNWIQHPVTPANLIMMYFEEPDETGHMYGPESNEYLKQVYRVDNTVKYIYETFTEPEFDNVNIIITSDHGMTSLKAENIIDIRKYVNESTFNVSGNTPTLGIFPKEGFKEMVYSELKEASRHLNFSLYLREELPDRWHIKNNDRCPPLFLLADLGYAFHDFLPKLNGTDNRIFGMHGYDNEASDMHPLFFAWGPRIKKNHYVKPFDTVNIYSFIIQILELPTNVPHNGSVANIADILVNNSSFGSGIKYLVGAVFSVLAAAGLFASIYIYRRHRKKRTGDGVGKYIFLSSSVRGGEPTVVLNPTESDSLLSDEHEDS